MIEIRDVHGNFPGTVKWSGEGSIPKIGETINVRMNGIGPAIVKSYFMGYGGGETYYLGVLAVPLSPPDWYVEQNGEDHPGHFFGAEVEVKE
jgi:hypothetical protein